MLHNVLSVGDRPYDCHEVKVNPPLHPSEDGIRQFPSAEGLLHARAREAWKGFLPTIKPLCRISGNLNQKPFSTPLPLPIQQLLQLAAYLFGIGQHFLF